MAYRISTLPASPLLSRTICIPTRALIFSIPKETFLSASLRPRRDENRISCSSDEHGESRGLFEGFSVLPRDVPWNDSDVWSTMALYFFSLHIPLSFGGLDAICQLLNRTELDPLTEATSIFLLQISEVILASALLRYTLGSWDAISVVFQKEATTKRSLLKTSAAGLGVLISAVLLTSFLADQLLGPKKNTRSISSEEVIPSSQTHIPTQCSQYLPRIHNEEEDILLRDPPTSHCKGSRKPQRFKPQAELKSKKQRTCSTCNGKGHNSRTCKTGATKDCSTSGVLGDIHESSEE